MTGPHTKVNLDRAGHVLVSWRLSLFDNPAKRFLMEITESGWSGIEKRGDEYWLLNFSTLQSHYLLETKISRKEVIKHIARHFEDAKLAYEKPKIKL